MAEKKNFPQKEKAEGVYRPSGETVKFNREWGGHRFTDAEVQSLLAGDEIEFQATSKVSGNPYIAHGKLEQQEYNGNEFWGFALDREAVPFTWGGHTFTPDERATLANGGSVYIQDAVSKKTGNKYACTLRFVDEDGRRRLKPEFDSKKG